MDTYDAIPTASLSQSDVSVQLLDKIFGQGWHVLVPGGDGGTMGVASNILFPILAKFNVIAWAAVGVLFAYTMAIGIAGTAHSGEPLGKRYSTLWTPLRFAFANAMLAPVVKGLSIFQVIILSCVGFSINFADWVWTAGLDYVQETGGRMSASTMPPALEREGQELALVMLKNMAIQDSPVVTQGYSHVNGAGVTPWRVVAQDDGAMQYVRLFTPPQPPDGLRTNFLLGDFGGVSVTCKDTRGLSGTLKIMSDNGCVARRNAVDQLITNLAPIARFVADSDRETIPGSLIQAVDQYNRGLAQNLTTHVLSLQDAALREELSKFVGLAKSRGWMSGASYYWTVARINEKASDSMLGGTQAFGVPPRAANRMAGLYLGFGVAEARYEKLKEASFGWERLGQDADLAALKGSESFWEKVKTVYARPFQHATSWIMDAMSGGGDPLMAISSYGHSIIDIGATGLALAGSGIMASITGSAVAGLGSALPVVGGPFAAAGAAVQSLGIWIAGILMFLAVPIFALGFVWAYYLPALPFLLYWSGIINWVILVVEALVAAPLWIAAHAMPEGEGMAGERGKQGYMLLLNILMRPALMVTGLWFGLFLVEAVSPVLNEAMKEFMYSVTGGTSYGLFGMAAMITIYTSILLIMAHKLLGLIVHLPDSIIRWIGGGSTSLGEHGDESRMRSIFAAVGSHTSGSVRGEQSMQRGRDRNGQGQGSEGQGGGSPLSGHITEEDLAQGPGGGGTVKEAEGKKYN